MKVLLPLCLLCFLIACSDSKISKLDYLEGTWKMEDKEEYEVWEKVNKNEFIGHSYSLKDNKKSISETLSIKILEREIVYQATVPNQNEGKTVSFILNKEIEKYLSFENLEHDFPKKIQYKRIHDHEIGITVEGEKGKGFSYTLVKQNLQ